MAFIGYLKQSTATTLKLGPFVDSTDGATAETALTITQADVRLSKNGGDYAQKNDTGSATHDELGEYDVALNATDTNTAGRLRVVVAEAGALIVVHDYVVLQANVFDSLIAGTEFLEVAGAAQTFDASVSPAEFYERDGTTTQFTRTLATDPAAEPITGAS